MFSGGAFLHPRVMVLFISLRGDFLFIVNPFSAFSLNYCFACTVHYMPQYNRKVGVFHKYYSIKVEKNPQFKIHINEWLTGFL